MRCRVSPLSQPRSGADARQRPHRLGQMPSGNVSAPYFASTSPRPTRSPPRATTRPTMKASPVPRLPESTARGLVLFAPHWVQPLRLPTLHTRGRMDYDAHQCFLNVRPLLRQGQVVPLLPQVKRLGRGGILAGTPLVAFGAQCPFLCFQLGHQGEVPGAGYLLRTRTPGGCQVLDALPNLSQLGFTRPRLGRNLGVPLCCLALVLGDDCLDVCGPLMLTPPHPPSALLEQP